MKNWSLALFEKQGKKKNVDPQILENAKTYIEKQNSNDVPVLLTLGHLAYRTSVEYKILQTFVSRRTKNYKTFQVRKHNGGFRNISVPVPKLMYVQKWINEFILSKAKLDEHSFAFQKEKSIKDCAMEHLGCRWLIKMDLRQFFESISEIDVFNYFNSLGYSKLLSFQLARICTTTFTNKANRYLDPRWTIWNHNYKFYRNKKIGHLPQGAPTSPMLANIIAKPLDEEIYEFLKKLEGEFVYTRYADDLFISTTSKAFSKKDAKYIINHIYSLLPKYGFKYNHQKTQIIPPGARKIVLGLLVDSEKLRLSKDFKSKLECHLYYLIKNPIQHASTRNFDTVFGLINHIKGLFTFAQFIEPEYIDKLERKKLVPDWDSLIKFG